MKTWIKCVSSSSAAGYTTQEALAKVLGYVREQVSKTESGGELPSDPLFAKWLAACRAPDARRQYLTGMLVMARLVRGAVPEFAKRKEPVTTTTAACHLWYSWCAHALWQPALCLSANFARCSCSNSQ